jgi:hypothetical protein
MFASQKYSESFGLIAVQQTGRTKDLWFRVRARMNAAPLGKYLATVTLKSLRTNETCVPETVIIGTVIMIDFVIAWFLEH